MLLLQVFDKDILESEDLPILKELIHCQKQKNNFPPNFLEFSKRQLEYIRYLLRKDKLEEKIVSGMLKDIRKMEKYKEYNVSLSEFNKILREKYVVDNIRDIIYEDITLFRGELLKLEEYILNEKDLNIKKWIGSENQVLRNLGAIFRKIVNEDELIKKYFKDIKDLRYDKRLMSGSRVLSKFVSNIMFKIEVEGANNIPKNGPAIFAAKHLHKRLDPVILKAVINRNLHFLVWSEYFFIRPFAKTAFAKKAMNKIGFFSLPFAKEIIHKLGGLPVYKDPKTYKPHRIDTKHGLKYGKEQVSTTFKHSIKLLKYGECLVLFPEGFHKIEQTFSENKNVRIPQSGFVYFQAYVKRKFNIDVPVVPIGLKYANEKYTNIIIRIGNPINVLEKLINMPWKDLDNNLINEYTVSIMDEIIKLSR